jgi:hypothetical protein
MKVGIFLTNQHPPGTDMIAALEGQPRPHRRCGSFGTIL